ncbi:MAG: hypothetical protein AAF541_15600 [Pseudomonadota bacterium]
MRRKLIWINRAAVFKQETSGWKKGKDPGPDYQTAVVDGQIFHRDLHPDLKHIDFRWAFERGDTCCVNYYCGAIVGWDFTTSQATQVLPGLVFEVPDHCSYDFASFTHQDHRGLGLADQRGYNWTTVHDYAEDESKKASLWYIDLRNSASLSAFSHTAADFVDLVGYIGYLKIGNRFFCWRDKDCAALGAGFKAAAIK